MQKIIMYLESASYCKLGSFQLKCLQPGEGGMLHIEAPSPSAEGRGYPTWIPVLPAVSHGNPSGFPPDHCLTARTVIDNNWTTNSTLIVLYTVLSVSISTA